MLHQRCPLVEPSAVACGLGWPLCLKLPISRTLHLVVLLGVGQAVIRDVGTCAGEESHETGAAVDVVAVVRSRDPEGGGGGVCCTVGAGTGWAVRGLFGGDVLEGLWPVPCVVWHSAAAVLWKKREECR